VSGLPGAKDGLDRLGVEYRIAVGIVPLARLEPALEGDLLTLGQVQPPG